MKKQLKELRKSVTDEVIATAKETGEQIDDARHRRSLVRELEVAAMDCGAADVVAACQIRGFTVSIQTARRIIAVATAATDNEWLKPSEVSKLTGRTKDTVLDAIRAERLKAINTGTLSNPRYSVHRDSLHDWKPKD